MKRQNSLYRLLNDFLNSYQQQKYGKEEFLQHFDEKFSRNDEIFGEKKLLDIVKENRELTVKELIREIVRKIRKWMGRNPANDDITLTGVERKQT